MFKITLVTIAVGLGVVYGPATPAQAETCAAHIASRGTTATADIEYHRIHGGESPCKGNSQVDNSDYDRDYRTSRWEDKTSFDCGWSWRGGFGC